MSEFRSIALGVITLWPLAYGAYQGGAMLSERRGRREVGPYRRAENPYSGGRAERLRLRSDDRFRRFHTAEVDLRPRLSMTALIEALAASLKEVPKAIPSLPLLTALARQMNAAGRITIGETPGDTLGVFRSGREQAPRIELSTRLERLHRNGVGLRWLSPVLMHELDHYLLYLREQRGEQKKSGRWETEMSAFEAMGYYLIANRHDLEAEYQRAKSDGKDEDVLEYYRLLRRITRMFLQGRLKDLVAVLYGMHGEPKTARTP